MLITLNVTGAGGVASSRAVISPGNTVSGNIQITGDNFPADAQAVVNAAGLESGYADLKTSP